MIMDPNKLFYNIYQIVLVDIYINKFDNATSLINNYTKYDFI